MVAHPAQAGPACQYDAMSELELRGRKALVTGAAARVGRAIAVELARAGCELALHTRKSPIDETAAEVRALGVRAAVVRGDQATDARRIVDEAAAALGGLDLLVCSAAAFEKVPAAELTRAQWDAMIASNLSGPFFLMQAALPHLRERSGAIVNLVDLCGTTQVWKGYAHYAAAKAGLATLTRLLALEWAPEVRVNAVAPGTVLFPEDLPDDERERVLRRIPLGRAGEPEDVARAVRFLASQQFMSGQILAVDGARSVNP
jgi:pteridine reductase